MTGEYSRPPQDRPSPKSARRASEDHGIDLGNTISRRIEELAAASSEAGRLTRIYLTQSHRDAVAIITRWMREAGMEVRLDAAGTVVGRYPGSAPGVPTMLLGSHIDTVRDAGRYDGNLGVIIAIAVVARLKDAGTRLPFAIEVLAFGDEEGVRFASTLGGSRATAGIFNPQILDERDADGVTRGEALRAFGCDPAQIPDAARDPANTLGYVEVHIEQGPVLEAESLPLAIVTAINGASRGSVTVVGQSGHAGTVPMNMRKDALLASAEMALAIEQRARQEPDLVATVGRLEITNAATNTVPGAVTFTLDVRSPSDSRRKAAVADIENRIAAIAAQRSVSARVAMTYDAPAAASDRDLSEALAASVEACGLPVRHMPSGAGHDAMSFRGRIPFTMLFVRCLRGISHHPDEFASAEDIDKAARVLEYFLLTYQQTKT